jgi:hypothetical protein
LAEITVSTASFIGAVLSVVFEKCSKNLKFFPERNAFQDEQLGQTNNPHLVVLHNNKSKKVSAWKTYTTEFSS